MNQFSNLMTMRALLVITLFFLVFALFGCSKKQPEAEEIRIGVILPLSGNTAWLGEQHKWGIELAVEDINSSGGVNSRRIVVYYEDDLNDPIEAVNAFKKIIRTHRPQVVISGMSSSSMAIVPIVEKEEVVLFANCGHPEIAKNSKWVFRNFLTSVHEGEVMAQLCLDELDIQSLAMLYINDAYGQGGKDSFLSLYTSRGGQVLGTEKYDKDGVDFRSEITKILGPNPKAIYVLGYGNATGIVIKQLRELGYRGILLGTNNFSGPPVTTIAGNAMEGTIFTAPYFSPELGDRGIQKFVKRVQERFGKEPYWNTAVEYDAIQILAEAFKKTTSFNSLSLKKSLESVGNFQGLAGNYEYNADGEWRLRLIIRTYMNGERIPYSKNPIRND